MGCKLISFIGFNDGFVGTDIPCLLLRNMGRGREYLFSSLSYNTDGLNGMRCYNGNILGLKRYGCQACY